MQTATKITAASLVVLVSVLSLSGCTDWKKEYTALDVEHQNLKGRYERQDADKGQLAEQLAQSERKIADLQKQISERKKTPAEATGFGKGRDVYFDPQAGTITVRLPDTILFNPGKAALKDSSHAELNQILSVIKSNYSGYPIDIVGHTDSDPIKKSPWKDNWELSAQRALSVLRYLVEHGNPEKGIRAVGCGAARPVAQNTTVAGKAKNRRVEIVVLMK